MTNAEKLAIRQAVRRKSVLVGAQLPDGRAFRGSGFVVWRSGPNAVLLTNAHVVKPGGAMSQTITVRPFAGAGRPVTVLPAYLATALQDDVKGYDYALLVVPDPSGALGDPVDMGDVPAVGDEVIAVGNPLDEDFLVDAGRVTQLVPTPMGAAVMHSALIDHGSSGGGLFNARGELVGINTFVTTVPNTAQQGIALATQGFLKAVAFRAATVHATTAGWQETGILVRPGAAYNVIATGAWKVSAFLPAVSGAGTGDASLRTYSPLPDLGHGALLLTVGPNGRVQAVDQWWKGAAPGPTMALVKDAPATGTLRFAINDKDVANNAGALSVVVVEWGGRP